MAAKAPNRGKRAAKIRRGQPILSPEPPPQHPASPKGRPTYEMGLVMGPTGCGKSTFANEVSDAYSSQGGRVWAVDPSDAWRGAKGVTPLWPQNGLVGLDRMLRETGPERRLPPGLMIFDDADKYMRHPTQVRDDWMTSFRHYRKDVILITRRPQGIPKDSISNATWMALFAGSMTEPGARAYMRETLDAKIVQQVPQEPYAYLYLYRTGALWSLEVRAVQPRKLRTIADKPM